MTLNEAELRTVFDRVFCDRASIVKIEEFAGLLVFWIKWDARKLVLGKRDELWDDFTRVAGRPLGILWTPKWGTHSGNKWCRS